MEMQSNEKIKNPLPDYQFSINDFRRDQVEILIEMCSYFGGNSLLQKQLKKEIFSQLQEKAKFYALVKKVRLDAFPLKRLHRAFEKLHAPQSFLNIFIKKPPTNLSLPLKAWQPPGTLEDAVGLECPEENLVATLPPNAIAVSGWKRLKQAFLPSFFMPDYCYLDSSHVYNRNCFFNCCLGTGFLVGLMMGFSYGKRYQHEFDKTRGSNMYASRLDAVRERHQSFVKGYGRYAFRWGWRYSFLAGSVYLLTQGLTIFRLKESVSHYIVGTFLPFSLYKWYRGPRGMLVYGAIGGIVIGLPLSFFCCFLGLNPRSAFYDAGVYPEASSKFYFGCWNDEQKNLNKFRFQALAEELQKPCNVDKYTSTENIYSGLFSTQAT